MIKILVTGAAGLTQKGRQTAQKRVNILADKMH